MAKTMRQKYDCRDCGHLNTLLADSLRAMDSSSSSPVLSLSSSLSSSASSLLPQDSPALLPTVPAVPAPSTVPAVPSIPSPSSSPSLSILDLAALYSRERLLVRPFRWTSQHLEVLQCSFDGPSPAPSTDPSTATFPPPYGNQRKLVRRLVGSSNFVARKRALDRILCTPEDPLVSRYVLQLYPFFFLRRPPLVVLLLQAFSNSRLLPSCSYGRFTGDNRFYDGFYFHFARRRVAFLRCAMFLSWSDDNVLTSVSPIVAYVDYRTLENQRREALQPRMNVERPNRPVWDLFLLKLKKITPPDPLRDPLIAALLIALAQKQRQILAPASQAAATAGSGDTSTFRVGLTPKHPPQHTHPSPPPTRYVNHDICVPA